MTTTPAHSFAVGPGRFAFQDRPLVAVWEMTQACDLMCKHCRAEAQPERIQAMHVSGGDAEVPDQRFRYASMNVNDGRGFVFTSHTGEVFPSGFLPVSVGSVRSQPLADLYGEVAGPAPRSPLFGLGAAKRLQRPSLGHNPAAGSGVLSLSGGFR